jgi:chemotaxis protein MotA
MSAMDVWAALSLLACLALAAAGLWLAPLCPGSAALIFVVGAGSAAFLFGRRPARAAQALRRAMQAHPQGPKRDLAALVEDFVKLSQKAKREGFLALESDVRALEEPLMRRGFQFVIDGASPDLVRSSLDLELESGKRALARERRLVRALGLCWAGAGVVGLCLGLSDAQLPAHRFGLYAAAWGAAGALAILRLSGRRRRRAEDQRRVQQATGVNPILVESSLKACLELSPEPQAA